MVVTIHQSRFTGQAGHDQSACRVFINFVRFMGMKMRRIVMMWRWRAVAIGVRTLSLKAGK